jgi:hypothetical protein
MWDAENDCPVWLGGDRKAHIGFSDPAKVQGSPEEILAVFRQVRDEIRSQVESYLTGLLSRFEGDQRPQQDADLIAQLLKVLGQADRIQILL